MPLLTIGDEGQVVEACLDGQRQLEHLPRMSYDWNRRVSREVHNVAPEQRMLLQQLDDELDCI